MTKFQNEIYAYKRLKMLQGALIPTLFGQGSFNGRPALVLSEIDGITLRQLRPMSTKKVNSGSVGYLMSRFRYMRNPGRLKWKMSTLKKIKTGEIGQEIFKVRVEVKRLKKRGDQSISIFLLLKANVKAFDSKVFVTKNNTYLCMYSVPIATPPNQRI